MIKKHVLYFIFLLLFACTDDSGTPISSIKYQLALPSTYNFEIKYFSDKYFDTKTLNSFNISDSTYTPNIAGFWEGKRIQNDKGNGYFINVKINQSNPFEGELKLYVYVNDTVLIDSASYTKESTEINLEGEIPKSF